MSIINIQKMSEKRQMYNYNIIYYHVDFILIATQSDQVWDKTPHISNWNKLCHKNINTLKTFLEDKIFVDNFGNVYQPVNIKEFKYFK